MYDFFRPILDFFGFIIDNVKILVSMVTMVFRIFTNLISILPLEITIAAGVLLSVCILYKVLGRESSG